MHLIVLFKADIRSKKINFCLQEYFSIMSYLWLNRRVKRLYVRRDNAEQECQIRIVNVLIQ